MAQLMKLVWGGTMGTTEQWSCSLHGLADDGAGPSISTIEGIVSAYQTNVGAGINAYAKLATIKLNFVTASDHYVTPDTPITHDVIPPVAGVGNQGAFQDALCISTMTAAPRGLASKGRWYNPVGPQSVGVSGQIDFGTATDMAAAALNYLEALKGAGFAPQVYSVKGATGRPITGVRVGRVVDTQRRRRRSVPEAYVLSGPLV